MAEAGLDARFLLLAPHLRVYALGTPTSDQNSRWFGDQRIDLCFKICLKNGCMRLPEPLIFSDEHH